MGTAFIANSAITDPPPFFFLREICKFLSTRARALSSESLDRDLCCIKVNDES